MFRCCTSNVENTMSKDTVYITLYVVREQNGTRSCICRCTCDHRCCTGMDVRSHGSPCEWCRGCYPESEYHSAGIYLRAVGPPWSGQGRVCSASCCRHSQSQCSSRPQSRGREQDCNSRGLRREIHFSAVKSAFHLNTHVH